MNMKYAVLATAALVFIPLATSKTAGDLCRGTAARGTDGNWYCSEVRAITYRNISQSGVYNRTTGVDPETGLCAHETVTYSAAGPRAPLFGEVYSRCIMQS